MHEFAGISAIRGKLITARVEEAVVQTRQKGESVSKSSDEHVSA